jgi:hypothetical protein
MQQRISGTTIKSLITVLWLVSCHQKNELLIQPIDKSFNQALLTGKGLDKRLYSTKEVMQYYQVSNYADLPGDRLLSALDSFALASFSPAKINHVQQVTVLFYPKNLLVDYQDQLYVSARENDNGRLIGYDKDLLASVSYEKIKENARKMLVRRLLYQQNKLWLKTTDTIIVP